MAPSTGRGHGMQRNYTRLFGAVGAAAAALAAALAMSAAEAANERPLFVALGAAARAPIGWIEFCGEHGREWDGKPLEARDVVLTPQAGNGLMRVNKWGN